MTIKKVEMYRLRGKYIKNLFLFLSIYLFLKKKILKTKKQVHTIQIQKKSIVRKIFFFFIFKIV